MLYYKHIKFLVAFSKPWRRANSMKKAGRKIASELLVSIIKVSNDKKLFTSLQLKDNLQNRFEIIVLVTSLFLWTLGKRHALSLLLLEALIEEIDGNYREMGVSDMRFAKIMKTTFTMLMVRIATYQEAQNKQSLENAICKFIYISPTQAASAKLLAAYCMKWRAGSLRKGSLRNSVDALIKAPQPLL